MPTIRKLRNKWQAIVRRKGFPDASKTFERKTDALHWARSVEESMERSTFRQFDSRLLSETTLGAILRRYRDEVSPRKRGGGIERIVLDAIIRRSVSRYSLENLAPTHLCAYRDERLIDAKPATVNKELGLIQHALQVAQRSWGYPLRDNPVKLIDKPKLPQGRDRRLRDGEFDALILAARRARNKHMEPLIRLAVETGMRQGELLSLRWADVNVVARTAFLPMTKNGYRRTVPLSSEALEVLRRLPHVEERLFPTTSEAVKRAWMRIRAKAGTEGLRFHDLRHEATSRFFEMGLSVPEVALITGHRDGRMLFRYTHLKAEDVAQKLSKRSTLGSQ